jgi:hypothetical protein
MKGYSSRKLLMEDKDLNNNFGGNIYGLEATLQQAAAMLLMK